MLIYQLLRTKQNNPECSEWMYELQEDDLRSGRSEYETAFSLFLQQNFESATQHLRHHLKVNPTDVLALHLLLEIESKVNNIGCSKVLSPSRLIIQASTQDLALEPQYPDNDVDDENIY